MPVKYVSSETAYVYDSPDNGKKLLELLWGDRVDVLSTRKQNGKVKVKARWLKEGWINADALGDEALLEIYFIDVGQGDGVLMVTPDRRHILIDGGYTREKQPHGKSAADFVDWKFFEEYGMDKVEIDVMISSHNDADHYGGLWDLIDPSKHDELDTTETIVHKFYHAGVSWWKTASSKRFLGKEKDGYLVDLLTNSSSIRKGLKSDSALQLQGEWANFLACVLKTGADVARLSYNPDKEIDFLPGFEQDKEVSIRILGPIETTVDGKPGVKDFGSDSQNTNGNSILLRVDYGKSRILLTGDLNQKSQQHILQSFSGKKQELAADLAKACHHGSDDCSIEFLQYVQAAATVISSGDDETHAHPRPGIVAASGITGFRKVENDRMITPLVYSTEISRSYRLGDPFELKISDVDINGEKIELEIKDESSVDIKYTHVRSGGLKPTTKNKTMNRLKVVDGIVYGLVNVRTDGNKILCATLNEGKSKWDVKVFYSRF